MYLTLKFSISMILVVLLAASIHPIFGCGKHNPKKRIEHTFRQLQSKLDLNQQQTEALHQIKAEFLQRSKAVHQTHKGNIGEMKEIIRQPKLDMNALGKLLAERRARYDKMHEFMLSRFQKIHAMLNPDQRQKLAEIVSKRKRFLFH